MKENNLQKRGLSILLVLVMTLGLVGAFPAYADDNDVISLTCAPVTVIEHTNGFEFSDEKGSWYHYNLEDTHFIYTATLRDGRVINGDMYSIMARTTAYIEVTDEQSFENQWGVGKHQIPYACGALHGNIEFEIIESPIASLEAKDLSVLEGTHGYWWTAFGEGKLIDRLYYQYDAFPETVTVTLKTGEVFTGERYEVKEQVNNALSLSGYYGFESESDQSDTNRWGIGEHTARISFMGAEDEFKYTVSENNIASIKVLEPTVEILPYTGGFFEGHYDEDKYIPNSWYLYFPEPQRYTVTEKDGKTFTGTLKMIEKEYGATVESFSYEMQNGYEDRWEENTSHEVPIAFMGRLGTYTVKILETPVKSVSATKASVVEYTDGIYDGAWDKDWNYIDHSWYRYSLLPAQVTVEFKDGTSFTGTPAELEEKYGSPIVPKDEQDPAAPYGVGVYDVSASFMGSEFTYEYEVTKGSDEVVTVTGVDFRDVDVEWNQRTFTDDGNSYYIYYPDFTVHFSDGTSAKSQDGGAGVNRVFVESVYDDGQLEKPWTEWSSHKVKISFAGVEGEFTVNVKGEGERSALRGDANQDGKINAKDVTAIMKMIVGVQVMNFSIESADVDQNGKLNAKDVTALMKYIVRGSFD